MTLKMLAIGILVLLGLSSVMNPKTFRAFLGGLATLCMALFFGYVILGGKQQQMPLLSKLQRQIGIQPDWVESATKRSETILKDFKSGTAAPNASDLLPPDASRVMERVTIASPIVVDGTTNAESIVAKMRVRIEQYLERYRETHHDIGVDKLTYRNIDMKLVKDKRAKMKDGREAIFLLFDEDFAQHVRTKGRHAAMKDRLKQLAVVLVAAGAVVTLAFASLKYINRKNEPLQLQDYLQQGDVSMV